MWASGDGYTETVRVLLEAKADPNITNEVKLHYMYMHGASTSTDYVDRA